MLSEGDPFSMLLSLAAACKHVPILASCNFVRGKLVVRGFVIVTLGIFLSEYPNLEICLHPS